MVQFCSHSQVLCWYQQPENQWFVTPMTWLARRAQRPSFLQVLSAPFSEYSSNKMEISFPLSIPSLSLNSNLVSWCYLLKYFFLPLLPVKICYPWTLFVRASLGIVACSGPLQKYMSMFWALEPMNVTLFRKSVFMIITKLKILSSSWI